MVNLSICVVLCLYITLVWGNEEMQELIEMLHNNCKAESGVEEDAIKAAQKLNFDMNNEKLKCYAFCIMSEMSIISEDGVVDPDALLAVMPEEKRAFISSTVTSCGSPSGSTPCESALLAFKCYADGSPEHFFFP